MEKNKESHSKAKDFKDVEKFREEKIANKALINKLLEINDGRFSVAK